MRTLSVSISDLEFSKFGMKEEKISFSELLDIVSTELTKKALNDSVNLAQQHKLSILSMDEITEEIKAVRKNAKGNTWY